MVNAAAEKRVFILFGDAPAGVDRWVGERLTELPYRNAALFTPLREPRIPKPPGAIAINDRLVTSSAIGILPLRNYTDRDHYMVELADVVIAIWNGDSRGTRSVYEYAMQIGRDAHLYRPEATLQPAPLYTQRNLL